MTAYAVIGANFGDEGKGLMTDYICFEKGADVVVRFNGGAQAGHTVVTPSGERHVFHHYGSGSFLGIPTFLSKFFVVNPILFLEERMHGRVYVDPRAPVTTPIDMLINQAFEKKGGHGSCGVGINETMQREKAGYGLTVAEMLNPVKVERIFKEWAPRRIAELGLDLTIQPTWYEVFRQHAETFASYVAITTELPMGSRPVFEGAQGLLLDQNAPDFPHVTHSNTGMKNVRELCAEWGVKRVKPIYVTRTYLTRHGAGPLPNESPMPAWVKDETNVPHTFQGTIRYAPFTPETVAALEKRVLEDAGGDPFEVAVTCADQSWGALDRMKKVLPVKYISTGPTRYNVRLNEEALIA